MIRGFESRISGLEQYRKPQRCYVINCSDPPTADDLSEISRAKAEGRRPELADEYGVGVGTIWRVLQPTAIEAAA